MFEKMLGFQNILEYTLILDLTALNDKLHELLRIVQLCSELSRINPKFNGKTRIESF